MNNFITGITGMREGVVLEKGVRLNEEYLNENFKAVGDLLDYFIDYPDLFIDMITPEESGFKLYFYQRIFLRAVMRFKTIYVTAPRAWSKSFLTILGLLLQCIFIPGRRVFICTPGKGQGAKIAKEKLTEIFRLFPLLRKEVIGGEYDDTPGNYGKDYVELRFRNGSWFDVVAPLDSTRGGRRHGGLIDEVRDHEEETLNKIVIPLLNVARELPRGGINEKEPNRQQIYATSAGVKSSFAYDALIDVFIKSIINPDDNFCMGCDYRVPMLHGLLQKSFVKDLKTSSSFNPNSFATEYLSLWSGGSSDSWFDYDRLNKYRILKNPEWKAKNVTSDKIFYLLSVDVGRVHDQTVVTVFRVTIDSQGIFSKSVTNIHVLGKSAEEKTFYKQAIELKKLIALYNPREVVIDTNGIGIGFGEEMTRPQIDPVTGEEFPPYGFFNDDNYKKTQPHDCDRILYSFKANSTLKPKIQSNAYTQITSGRVHFLISEQRARTLLLETKTGARMNPEKRALRLLPHEMTSRLFDEILNFKVKKTAAVSDFVLEPINSKYPDDKFYSFCYGLWRLKELEEECVKKIKRREGRVRQLIFYN